MASARPCSRDKMTGPRVRQKEVCPPRAPGVLGAHAVWSMQAEQGEWDLALPRHILQGSLGYWANCSSYHVVSQVPLFSLHTVNSYSRPDTYITLLRSYNNPPRKVLHCPYRKRGNRGSES